MITVDLRGGPGRGVVALGGGRSQRRRLEDSEHLGRACLDGAVDAHPRPHPRPDLGTTLSVGQIHELLPRPERTAHERHHALHRGLVLGLSHPGRIDHEPARLRILQKRRVDPRVERIGLVDDRLQIVGDDHSEHPVEELPGRLTTGDDILQGLPVREPHEHVP